MLWAAWFGVITGFLELSVLLVRNAQTGGVALGVLRLNRHFTWMVPVADVLIFLACGLALYVVSLIRPRLEAKVRPFVLCFLAFLALLLLVPRLYQTAPLALAGGFALLVGRPILAGARGFGLRTAASLPCFVAGLTCLSAWVSGKDVLQEEWVRFRASKPGPAAPNVLLIVMDTVRAASLSLHGYHRDTSPNLVRIAERGVTFEQARATAPWTLPSHASMFTGRWPHDLSAGEKAPLDATCPTIAEYLSSHGYATGGFVANVFFCNAWYGLARGFEHYDDFYGDEVTVSIGETLNSSTLGRALCSLTGRALPLVRRRKDAARVNRDFLRWLPTVSGRPFFAFLNYFDAHAPYLPPEGFQRRFGRSPLSAGDYITLMEWNERSRKGVSAQTAELALDGYDDCIASLDQELGNLFDELERRGVRERTLIIITSDHGEAMGEHGFYQHGMSLYDQEVHVPLMVIPPGKRSPALRISQPVSLRQIPATIVDLLDVSPGSPFPGASLARFWRRRATAMTGVEGPVVSEAALLGKVSTNLAGPPAWRGKMSSLVAGGMTYIRNADGSEELYDVAGDPGQNSNRAHSGDLQPVLDNLRAALRGVCPEINWTTAGPLETPKSTSEPLVSGSSDHDPGDPM